MTVFKTYLKILNKYKYMVIMYTGILLLFGAFNVKTGDNNVSFSASKPDILIINNDVKEGITQNLIDYMAQNANLKDIKNDEEAISDALFYRDISYIIYIPRGFREDFLRGQNPKIEVETTGDMSGTFTNLLLERYLKIATSYRNLSLDEDKIIQNINSTLEKEARVEITSKLNTEALNTAKTYYNFASYSMLAGCVYVICLILSSFKNKNIHKRNVISSVNYQKFNMVLLLSNALFAFMLWLFYVVISFIIVGSSMFTPNGILIMLNSLLFTLCALTMAFLIANIITNKDALNGIINVVALGSSFLCGAFVPMQWLPDFVLKIAHALPSYWYIKSNEVIGTMELFTFEELKPILLNMGMLLVFSLIFTVLAIIIARRKRKIA